MGIGYDVRPIAPWSSGCCNDDFERETNMKRSLMFLTTLILILLLSGCTSTSDLSQPATVTPGVVPRLDPSPTPSGSILPLTCQVTDLNVYINEADGYCFAFPSRFTLGDQPSDKPDLRGPAIDDSAEPIHATLSVEVSPAALGKSLREQAEAYLKEFSVVDPATFTWNQIQVDGEIAWEVEPIPAMLAYRIVFVQHNGFMFRLMYWPVDIPEAQPDLNDLTQTTLGSFAFTK
jgi:hypothetical protein